jgi:hypothetical protein
LHGPLVRCTQQEEPWRFGLGRVQHAGRFRQSASIAKDTQSNQKNARRKFRVANRRWVHRQRLGDGCPPWC